MLQWLKARANTRRTGRAIYDSIVAQSRAEPFYRELGVPDTLEGRFEVTVVHMVLVLDRLQREGEVGRKLARALIESFVTDMDDSMRELGISDIGVPRRVKRAAAALYERASAYQEAPGASAADDGLASALAEHVYAGKCRDARRPLGLAHYVREAGRALAQQPLHLLLAGSITFPAAPAGAASEAGPSRGTAA
jgi:cytochrome b pre-mRNA-processing protein 3